MQLNSMEHIEKLKKTQSRIDNSYLTSRISYFPPLHCITVHDIAWHLHTRLSDHLYLCAYPDASNSDIKNWTHRYLYVYRHRITFYNHTFLDFMMIYLSKMVIVRFATPPKLPGAIPTTVTLPAQSSWDVKICSISCRAWGLLGVFTEKNWGLRWTKTWDGLPVI